MKKKLIIAIAIFLIFTITYVVIYCADAGNTRSVQVRTEISEEANLFEPSYSDGKLKLEHRTSCELYFRRNSALGETVETVDSYYIDIENSDISKDGIPLTYDEKAAFLKEIAASEKGLTAADTKLTDPDDGWEHDAFFFSGTYEGNIKTYPLHERAEIPTKFIKDNDIEESLTTHFFSVDLLVSAGSFSVIPTAGVLFLISWFSSYDRRIWKIVTGIILILGYAGFLTMVYFFLKYSIR